MKIDIFTHVMPKPYFERLEAVTEGKFALGGLLRMIPELTDLSMRIAIMDELGIDQQVITLASPPVEQVIEDPVLAAEMAAMANDGIAEMAAQYPGRFIPVGNLAMNNMEAGLRETERCIEQLGMKGMLIYSSARGRAIDNPEFLPFYERMAGYDLPIWLHPERTPQQSDYVDEPVSKFAIWQLFGWPFETTAAMTRLVFSGLFDRHPDIKIITHHAGAMVPFFDKRIEYVYPLFDKMGAFGDALEQLKKPVIEYFRMFYNDTAVMGSLGGMVAAHAFFGTERLLFGTDSPFDTYGGKLFTSDTVFSIDAMALPPADKAQIFGGNARRLLKLG